MNKTIKPSTLDANSLHSLNANNVELSGDSSFEKHHKNRAIIDFNVLILDSLGKRKEVCFYPKVEQGNFYKLN